MKEKIKDILWSIRAFILQPIVPTVSMQYLFNNDCSYIANNCLKDKYVYYWKGDFKKGKAVKVKALDHLRHEYREIEMENELLSSAEHHWKEKLERVKEVKTFDPGENFVKNEIVKILEEGLE